jgi:hypothetical protein
MMAAVPGRLFFFVMPGESETANPSIERPIPIKTGR